jgi:hypothetical protein
MNAQNLSRWSKVKANEWYKQQGWLVGCNYTPAYAINQLECWQEESFDTAAINKELSWAGEIGFNVLRVYLHDLLWLHDSSGLLKRMDQFLTIATRHGLKSLFVFFDSVWDPDPATGKQRPPRPHVHNSGWVQSPGREVLKNMDAYPHLENYVKGIIRQFANDKRVLAWETVNEPDNPNIPAYDKQEPPNKLALGLELLKRSFRWASEVARTQPLTAAPWWGDWSHDSVTHELNRFCFDNSDIISFHNYDGPVEFAKRVGWLKRFGRPVICSEYMARPRGSTFQNILPICKANNVGAINWGFVNGKTQTIYPWETWTKTYTAMPELWFHDIFWEDGKPYDEEEVRLIKRLVNK